MDVPGHRVQAVPQVPDRQRSGRVRRGRDAPVPRLRRREPATSPVRGRRGRRRRRGAGGRCAQRRRRRPIRNHLFDVFLRQHQKRYHNNIIIPSSVSSFVGVLTRLGHVAVVGIGTVPVILTHRIMHGLDIFL